MRIVFDPDQMVRTARLMTEAGEDYSTRGTRLITNERPAMPPDVAMRVDAGIRSAAAALDDTALHLEAEALMLRARASLVAGDAGLLAAATLAWFSAAIDDVPGES